MAGLIGAAILFIAAVLIYGTWRWALADDRTHASVLDRWAPRVDLPPDTAPDTSADVREAELTRQLLAGVINPGTYQRAMSELAHSSTQAEGPR